MTAHDSEPDPLFQCWLSLTGDLDAAVSEEVDAHLADDSLWQEAMTDAVLLQVCLLQAHPETARLIQTDRSAVSGRSLRRWPAIVAALTLALTGVMLAPSQNARLASSTSQSRNSEEVTASIWLLLGVPFEEGADVEMAPMSMEESEELVVPDWMFLAVDLTSNSALDASLPDDSREESL